MPGWLTVVVLVALAKFTPFLLHVYVPPPPAVKILVVVLHVKVLALALNVAVGTVMF